MTEGQRSIDYGDRGAVRIVADADELALAAVDALIAAADGALAEREAAWIALSGGSTPKAMGQLLARSPHRERVDWSRLHVFWGDERWVPLESAESNAGEAMRTFLTSVPIPPEHIHVYDTVTSTPEVAAARYEQMIGELLPRNDDQIPMFDLVLLGMGHDGHTASLFPETGPIHETKKLVVGHFVPKLDTIRLTFTPPLINAAREVVFLVSGSGKAERLAEVLDGPDRVDELPSQSIRPASGGPTWLIDANAASSLARRPR